MLRSILAVLFGYAVFAVSGVALFQLTGIDPHGAIAPAYMAGFVVYGIAFALLGGYLGGWSAGRRPFVHGAAVAALLATGASASLVSMPAIRACATVEYT